jgi:hypothetical protein
MVFFGRVLWDEISDITHNARSDRPATFILESMIGSLFKNLTSGFGSMI